MNKPLDRIDIAIVAQLQKDARTSNKELAALVGLAPSSCLERVRRLQRDSVIRGYHADVDPKALGIGIQAMVAIRLSAHQRQNMELARAHLRALPEVVHLYHLSGADDFLVHVAARDADHLRHIVMNGVSSLDVVANVETSLIFEHTRGTMQATIP
jgi:DNA-binding Lrp family transcriptional regulator